MILGGYVSTIKQDPIMFKWNFIDLESKKMHKQVIKGLIMEQVQLYLTFSHMCKNLQYRSVQSFHLRLLHYNKKL